MSRLVMVSSESSHALAFDDGTAAFNWCIVPFSGYDAVLFVGVALLVACLVVGKLSALNVLLVGAIVQTVAYSYNLGRLGNSISLWIGLDGKAFFYVFLPPLLLDSALRIDFYMFRKVLGLSLTFAFLIVAASTFLSIPILLWVLRLDQEGWSWVHCALFSAMVASTDAAAVSSNLKAGGAPELLSALLEGESLFNDGSGLVLFDIFLAKLYQDHSRKPHDSPSVIEELGDVAKEFSWLVGGGLALGLFFGSTASQILRFLQWRRSQPYIEVTVTLAGAYLSYFVADAYLESSGVIAVVCFGLWGSANQSFGISIKAKREKWLAVFWETCVFGVNSVVFFFVGVSAMNYILRLSTQLEGIEDGFEKHKQPHERLLRAMTITLPLIYISMTLLRGLLIAVFAPIVTRISKRGIELSWREIIFATMGGMRGGVSLILAQSVLMLESSKGRGQGDVISEMGLFTAGFVLLTLFVNGPLLAPLMTFLQLNATSAADLSIRMKTKKALHDYTVTVIDDLKTDGQQSMRGVDWAQVESYVNLDNDLNRILPTKIIVHDPSSTVISRTIASLVPMAARQSSADERKVEQETEEIETRGDIEGGLAADLGLSTPLLSRANTMMLDRRGSMTAVEKGMAWLSHAHGSNDGRGQPIASPRIITHMPSFNDNLATVSRTGNEEEPLRPNIDPIVEAAEDLDEQYESLMAADQSSACFFRTTDTLDAPVADEGKLPLLSIPSFLRSSSLSGVTPQGRGSIDGHLPRVLSRSNSLTSPGVTFDVQMDAASPAALGEKLVRLPSVALNKLEAVREEPESQEEHDHLEAQEAELMSAFITELIEHQDGQMRMSLKEEEGDQGGQDGVAGNVSPDFLLGEDGPSWRASSESLPPPPPHPSLPLAEEVQAGARRSTSGGAEKKGSRRRKASTSKAKKLDPVLTVTNRNLTYSSETKAVTEGHSSDEDEPLSSPSCKCPIASKSFTQPKAPNADRLDTRLAHDPTLLRHPSFTGFGTSSWVPVGPGLVRNDNSPLMQATYKKVHDQKGAGSGRAGSKGSDHMQHPEIVPYRLTAMGERVASSSTLSSSSKATRGSTSGALTGHSSASAAPIKRIIEEEEEEGVGGDQEQEALIDLRDASEYRLRLLSGLKRYFHLKHEEGLLSSQGLRILSWCINLESDQSTTPLTLWDVVEGEVKGKGLVGLIASVHFTLRTFVMYLRSKPARGRMRFPGSLVVAKMVQWVAAMLARHLSRVMMIALEVALELWQALTASPQIEWLEYAGRTGALLKVEVEEQAELCWRFIIDREIEAPDRFCAIQSHRAAMAVLRQQATFVTQLYDAGAVNEHESEELVDPIERRMWRLEMKGPRWRQPSLSQVLSNIPFLQNLPSIAVDWFKLKGRLQRFKKGDNIGTDLDGPQGMFVVINGMVRCELHEDQSDTNGAGHDDEDKTVETFYIGTGGVGGLTSALLGGHIAGTRSRHAYAEGNALGRGPVLFILSQEVIREMRSIARAHKNGDEAHTDRTKDECLGEAMVTLEVHMYRLAGLFIVDRNRQQIVSTCTSTFLSAVHDAETKLAGHTATSTHDGALIAAKEAVSFEADS